MENNKLCKLCYSSDKPIINIFDENGIKLNMAQILKNHFWFKIIENDCVSNGVCTDCWWKTENFHKFYIDVKIAHNNYTNISYKPNKLFHFKTKSIVREDDIKHPNKCNDDIKFVKIESVDNGSDGMDLNEIVCDTMITQNPTEGITTGIKDEIENLNIDVPNSFRESESSAAQFEDLCANSNDEKCSVFDTNNKNTCKTMRKRKLTIVKDKTRKRKITKYDLTKPSAIVKKQKKVKAAKTSKIITCEKTNEANALEKKLQTDKEDIQIREYFKMECEICNHKFITFLEAKAHYREQHQIKGFIKCCKRKFFRRGVVLEHIVKHLNPDAYKCHFCDRIYSNKMALKHHIHNHAPSEDKPYKCGICPKSFLKKCHLTQHEKYRHYTEEDKKFACDICKKSFLTKCYLTAHIRGVHENAFVQICDICARVFKSKAVLDRHRESHFGVDTAPKLQCNICGSWLKYKHSLRAHLARHKDTKHNCPQCGKESANKDSLRDHIRYVHTDKFHICQLCDKPFKRPLELREHMASHTGETLYTCPHCPKTFNSSANMHSHRKKKHPIEWQENRGQRVAQIQNL